MRKGFLSATLVFSLAISCLPAIAFKASTPPAQRNAILFCWDGAQRNHVKECLAKGELPNLAALIKEGAIVNIDITKHATDTKAGHTQMLTGLDNEVTGVFSNGKFKAIAPGWSIFEKLDKQFGDDNITTIMLTGKGHHIGACAPSTPEQIQKAQQELNKLQAGTQPKGKNKNQQAKAGGNEVTGVVDPDAAVQAAQKKKAKVQGLKAIIQNTEGEPFLNVSKAIDVWDGEKGRNYDAVGPLMLGYLDKYGKGRFFAFFHYSDPDHMGHNHGENSKEYTTALINCDKKLGECVKKLKELGVYDKTMIFVNADHGFDEGKTSHINAPWVTLAANMKSLKKDGNQRDIVPTILSEMGVDVSKLEPKLSGNVLTK